MRDMIAQRLAAENCSELCYYGMMWGALGDEVQPPLLRAQIQRALLQVHRGLCCCAAQRTAPSTSFAIQHSQSGPGGPTDERHRLECLFVYVFYLFTSDSSCTYNSTWPSN